MPTTTSERLVHTPFVVDKMIPEAILATITKEVDLVLSDNEAFPKKFRNENFFKRPSQKINQWMQKFVQDFPFANDLTWHFEIFYSKKPVGLHNDRNLFADKNELCELGLILPLNLEGSPHFTRFFDLLIPKKVNWDGSGNFRQLNKEIYPHQRSDMENYFDAPWEKGRVLFFDSCQVHEAIFPKSQEGFKLSINGLGYSDFKVRKG